jgi:hypothetical protein
VVNALVLTIAQLEPEVLPRLEGLDKLVRSFEEDV